MQRRIKTLHSEPNTSGRRASEIAQTLADLHSSGIEATYYTCDVTDPKAVDDCLSEVVKRYGRIDGIIHGAGVLRDGFLGQMTPDDFSMVANVKFLGAWNLFSAAQKAGLKFFVGLSSVAAIQGNPGQTNYAAANRMMSALIRYLSPKIQAVRFKALMLPPIEGAGMAEDPEVRDMLKRKGVGYIHVNELAGLFCRELFVAPADDHWVMFMRKLPAVKTARINDTIPPLPNGKLGGGTVAFELRKFTHDRGHHKHRPASGATGGRKVVFSGQGPLDRRPQAFPIRQASPDFSGDGSGDIHGSRKDCVSSSAGARGSSDAIYGYDTMSSGDFAAVQDILSSNRRCAPRGDMRSLSFSAGDIPDRKIDRPLFTALYGPGNSRWRPGQFRGWVL